jgi:hypothetical protein
VSREFIAVLISGIALIVAVYGIFERRSAAFAALRVRITELVSAVQMLSIEEQQYQQAHPDLDWDEARRVLGSFQARRALLTYQALALLDRLRKARIWEAPSSFRLTPEEHAALAHSLEHLRDLASARDQWADAVVAAEGSTNMVRATMHGGYAACLFELGKTDAGRHHYRRAIETYPDRWDVFCTYVEWADAERAADGRGLDEPLRSARELADTPTSWQASARRILGEFDSQAASGARGERLRSRLRTSENGP